MNRYKNLLIAVLAVLLIGGGLAIWNAGKHRTPDEPPDWASGEDAGPTVVGQNVSFTVTEGEVKKWKLDANKANYNDTQTEADLSDITGQFYDAEGKPVMTFTAPTGHYASKDNAVVLSGGVIARSLAEDGGSMKAPTMTWSAKTKKVLAEGGVHMIYPGLGESRARQALFSLDFSEVELKGNVHSEIDYK